MPKIVPNIVKAKRVFKRPIEFEDFKEIVVHLASLAPRSVEDDEMITVVVDAMKGK